MYPSTGSLAAPRPASMLTPSYTATTTSPSPLSSSSSPSSSASSTPTASSKRQASDPISRPYSIGCFPAPVGQSSLIDYHAILSELSDPSPRPRDSLIPYREAPKELELLQETNEDSRDLSSTSEDKEERKGKEDGTSEPGDHDYQRLHELHEEMSKDRANPSMIKADAEEMSVAVGVAVRTAVPTRSSSLRIIRRPTHSKRTSTSTSATADAISPTNPSRSLSTPNFMEPGQGRCQSVILPEHVAPIIPQRTSISISPISLPSSATDSPVLVSPKHIPSSGSSQYSTPVDTPSVMISSPMDYTHPSEKSSEHEDAFFFKEVSTPSDEEQNNGSRKAGEEETDTGEDSDGNLSGRS
ncbi:hypothetical protein BJ684DRAFT_20949 [Piptocephalis cylindrospora]|uniref:Uncharacterized protein n=1 Tax=Piptocephalis cylindrospora TaxID=1907219 RepID=A0A4P9Y1H7_9FUNG|nr:hypothetical protein BJ684DRAFT_20949 [Piptocephalis cylindrospora]|eukprot:RKP12524.1 hypothetical protein BJ684DRAFT_20949 [Piptocephalis cylindrospora]